MYRDILEMSMSVIEDVNRTGEKKMRLEKQDHGPDCSNFEWAGKYFHFSKEAFSGLLDLESISHG